MEEIDVLEISHCLKQNKEKILALWAERARNEIPAASDKPEPILRDALPLFINNLVRALSPNEPENPVSETAVAKEHAGQRDRQGDYSLGQVISEYFILQKTIIEVLEVQTLHPLPSAARDTILESIALAVKEAGVQFVNLQMRHLETSNEALEHFAHIASHDLQEPLRTVGSHVSLIQRKLGEAISDDTNQSFEYVKQATKRMKAMMDSLLSYSEVGRAKEKMVLTDFNEALNHAVSNLQLTIKDTETQVVCDPLPTVMALPIEIERLFQNLIANALKFRKGNAPTIHISAVSNDKDWLFSVTDNGIGIEANQLEGIFKLFSRLHSKDKYPGSGIGLSVCRRVVELHGGTIWAEKNPTGGTIFKFTIPK